MEIPFRVCIKQVFIWLHLKQINQRFVLVKRKKINICHETLSKFITITIYLMYSLYRTCVLEWKWNDFVVRKFRERKRSLRREKKKKYVWELVERTILSKPWNVSKNLYLSILKGLSEWKKKYDQGISLYFSFRIYII